MSFPCPTCELPNSQRAYFCRACGAVLPRGSQRLQRGNNTRLLPALIIFGLALGAAALLRDTSEPNLVPARSAQRSEQQHFQLSREKARALVSLIAPDDIQSLIIRHPRDGNVRVDGTPEAMAVLERFVDLITRLDRLSPAQKRSNFARLEKHWDTQRSYRLPRLKRDALYQILAFSDVPVMVAKRGRNRSTAVTVEATGFDQATVADMVGVLHGGR